MSSPPLLEIENLGVSFPGHDERFQVLAGVNLCVQAGETVGLVGESGSGKSVTALAALGLLGRGARVDHGSIRFRGQELTTLTASKLRAIRGAEIAMIFQDPVASLNPAFTVGAQIAEVIVQHTGVSKRAARSQAASLLEEVGLHHPAQRLNQYPHEFSGGMCQRIVIALALSASPSLLLADEPTTALDVTTQSQIVSLLLRLAQERNMSMLFATHDLALVSEVSDKIAVMYAGRVVEFGAVDSVFVSPQHPYTQALLACATQAGVVHDTLPILGSPPTPGAMPDGCRFHPRCPHVREDCRTVIPATLQREDGHSVACHRAEELQLAGVTG